MKDDLRGAVRALHERLTLQDVHFERLLGEVVGDLPLEVRSVSIGMEDPSVIVEPPRFACRFVHRVVLKDQDGDQLARAETTLRLEFTIDGEERPMQNAVRKYLETNALFLAYPYLREAVQTTTLRLGLDPVVLGVLSRGESHPVEVTLVQRSSGDGPD